MISALTVASNIDIKNGFTYEGRQTTNGMKNIRTYAIESPIDLIQEFLYSRRNKYDNTMMFNNHGARVIVNGIIAISSDC